MGSTAIEFILRLAVMTLVARVLGVDDYGRLTLVVASVTSIRQLVDVRAWEGATRYLAEFLVRRESRLALATLKLAVLADVAVAITACGAIAALSTFVTNRLLHQPDLAGPMRWYGLILLFTAVNGTAEAVLRVFNRFRELAARWVAQSVWHLGLVTAALMMGARIRGLLLAYLVSELAGAILLAGLAGRQIRQQLWKEWPAARLTALRPYWKEMLWFTAHTALRATLKLERQLGFLFLGYFRSPAEVGYYRVAYRMGRILQEIADPFYYAVFPEFARSGAGRRRLTGQVARTATMATVGALFSVLAGVLFAPAVIHLWVGVPYAPAVGPFRVIMVAMGLSVATFWGTPAALGSGRPDIATRAMALAVLVDVVLLLLPRLGAMGAAIGLLAGSVTFAIAISTLLTRSLPPARSGNGGGNHLE
jgi:O-antigen/teichoic acid export membrane protein